MANALSPNGVKVLNYIIENKDKNLTTQDIAEALQMEKKSVEGTVTSGLIGRQPNPKNLVEKVSGGFAETDKGIKEIKYVKVTEAGLAYDHEAAVAKDIEAKSAAKTQQ